MNQDSRARILGMSILAAMAVSLLSCSYLLLTKEDNGTSFEIAVPMTLDVLAMGLYLMFYLSIFTDRHRDLGALYFSIEISIAFIVLLFDVLSWYAEGNASLANLNELSVGITLLGNTSIALVMWLYLGYLLKLPQQLFRKMNLLVRVLYAVSILNILCNPLHHHLFIINDSGDYVPQDFEIISYLIPLIISLLLLYIIYRYVDGRRKRYSLYCFSLLPTFTILLTNLFGGVEVVNLIVFLTLLILYGNFYVKRSEELVIKESELVKQRADILVSQIQPHFLYNALTSIMNIKGNSPETRDAIADFGKYLRGNLDTLKQRAPIPFTKELDHVETFIELEKLNKGEGLVLETHIHDRNFLVPALCLQKLVEICIDNGYPAVNPKGRIILTTDETDNAHVITVEDDGKGFDTNEVLSKDSAGVFGIHAVEARLVEQVNGTLDIESTLGVGTIITIAIPKSESGPRKIGSVYRIGSQQ